MTVVAAALLVAAAVAVLVGVVAVVLRRGLRPEPPTQPRRPTVPAQVDRSDFARPEAPWLLAVFTSATCLSCRDTVASARALESDEVAVDDVDVGARGDIHRRYGITAVPVAVVADTDGVVRASFVGPLRAEELRAALAQLRRS